MFLNTPFLNNYAEHTGAIAVTSYSDEILTSCEDNRTRRIDFLTRQELDSLKFILPENHCSSWKGNDLASNDTGNDVGTLGQRLNLSLEESSELRLYNQSETIFVLENVTSLERLPIINVTVLDGFGVGPAPTFPVSFEARLSSPDRLFTGVYVANITNGIGFFEGIIGFNESGNYSGIIRSNIGGIKILNIIFMVRDCLVGEELTNSGKQCQSCDSVSYNFDPKDAACQSCPEEGNCSGRYIVPIRNHWNKSPCHKKVQKCVTEEACNKKNRTENLLNYTANLPDCNMNETILHKYTELMCEEVLSYFWMQKEHRVFRVIKVLFVAVARILMACH